MIPYEASLAWFPFFLVRFRLQTLASLRFPFSRLSCGLVCGNVLSFVVCDLSVSFFSPFGCKSHSVANSRIMVRSCFIYLTNSYKCGYTAVCFVFCIWNFIISGWFLRLVPAEKLSLGRHFEFRFFGFWIVGIWVDVQINLLIFFTIIHVSFVLYVCHFFFPFDF